MAPSAEARPTSVGRGLLVALLAIPVGIAAWLIVWSLGYVVAAVPIAVALLSVFLFHWGSRGARMTFGATAALVALLIGTVAVALVAGVALDVASALEVSVFDVVGESRFWDVVFSPEVIEASTKELLFAGLATVLGCGYVIRGAIKSRSAA